MVTPDFRLRIWRSTGIQAVPGADPVAAALAATNGDAARAASVETEDGEGPVLLVAIGGRDVHHAPAFQEDYDGARLSVRTWEVDDAFRVDEGEDLSDQLMSSYETFEPDLYLSDFQQEILREANLDGVRLLTLESVGDGHVVIVAASWFDPAFEADDQEDDV